MESTNKDVRNQRPSTTVALTTISQTESRLKINRPCWMPYFLVTCLKNADRANTSEMSVIEPHRRFRGTCWLVWTSLQTKLSTPRTYCVQLQNAQQLTYCVTCTWRAACTAAKGQCLCLYPPSRFTALLNFSLDILGALLEKHLILIDTCRNLPSQRSLVAVTVCSRPLTISL